MEQETLEVLRKIVETAKTVPMIKRIWVFGSRLKGTATHNSDLDLAVEIEWVPNKMLGTCEDPISLWCAVTPHFEKQMMEVCPWPLDLQHFVNDEETPNVAAYILECSQLIYEKNA